MNGRTLLIILLVVAVMVTGRLLFPLPEVAHIQLPAETIAHVGPIPITNTMVAGWLASLVLLVLFWLGTSSMSVVPSGLQNFIEFVSEFLLGLCQSVAGVGRGRQFFPLVASLFLFIMTANWMGLLPGYGTIGIWEAPHHAEAAAAAPAKGMEAGVRVEAEKAQGPGGTAAVKEKEKAGAKDKAAAADDHHDEKMILVPLLRSAATDLNTTLALALIAVIAVQIFGLGTLGGEYVQRFFNFREGPIGIFVGFLELIAELGRVLSFAFRLFGNVFAGEVVLAVITFLLPWVATLPFLGLELFVGFIQALVFAMLTLVFLTLATTSHHPEGHGHQAQGPVHGQAHGPAHH